MDYIPAQEKVPHPYVHIVQCQYGNQHVLGFLPLPLIGDLLDLIAFGDDDEDSSDDE
jgi:hypothetical protein